MADNGTTPKFQVSSGLLDPRHWKAMGSAVWVYLVLLDWQTDKKGTVMKGEPVQASLVSARLGCNERTVRRELERLESENYIRRERSGNGWLIWVLRPKKRFRTDLSKQPDRNVLAGQKCPVSRTDLSGLSSFTPLRGSVIALSEPNGRARDRLAEIFETLRAEHPRGHNPKPDLARETFMRRFESPAQAEECLLQHRESWQPVWHAGRKVPDLHNWIREWDPDADISPQESDRNRAADEPREARGMSPDEVIALVKMLGESGMVERVKPYLEHEDERVREAARQITGGTAA